MNIKQAKRRTMMETFADQKWNPYDDVGYLRAHTKFERSTDVKSHWKIFTVHSIQCIYGLNDDDASQKAEFFFLVIVG